MPWTPQRPRPPKEIEADCCVTLYTPEMLSLAADLADYPLEPDFARRANARSRTCGSVIAIGIDADAAGRIERVGMQVTACAVGQASAAIMARALAGHDGPAVAAMHDGIAAWLEGTGTLPDWPQFDLLAPALPHKGRHGALLLPWTAARRALCEGTPSG